MVSDLAGYQLKLVRAERVAAWQEIARRIAHEIKNPLSPIQVSIETMRKAYSGKHAEFPEIFEESTKAILEEVAALKRIVTEFSDFARLPKPSPVRQDVNPIAESAVGLYGGQHGEVEITFVPASGLPEVRLDRELFGQVLSNLIANAVRAAAPAGRVVVETNIAAERVLVRVRDTGSGMSPEVLEKVFTPYFTTHPDGTGLGLAIVQRIVEDHEGTIEIESVEGKGTAVTISLPLASA
jgi:nitrogen fixation/metabolism regulation signal transduction histidine kinase